MASELPKEITLQQDAKALLSEYAGVPEDQMIEHVRALRDKAWNTCPYPCVKLGAFTWPSVQRQRTYSQVLEGLKNGQTFLDLGCGFGQNIRKLVHDGAPQENIYGADIAQALVDCGYEYFKDRTTLKSKFIIGDILDENSKVYADAKESFDFIYASMMYHLFGWDEQVKACISTLKLLKPVAGSKIFGWQLGATPAGEIERTNSAKKLHKRMYQHDEESWRKMWEEIGDKTGTSWEVQVSSLDLPENSARAEIPVPEGSSLKAVSFSVTRL